MSIHTIYGSAVAELDDRTADITDLAGTDVGEILIAPVFSNQGTGNFMVLIDSDGDAFKVEAEAFHNLYAPIRSNGETALYAPKAISADQVNETLLSTVANHTAGATAEKNTAVNAMKAQLTETEVALLPTIAQRGQTHRDDCDFMGSNAQPRARAA